jgi:hypothetical protein
MHREPEAAAFIKVDSKSAETDTVVRRLNCSTEWRFLSFLGRLAGALAFAAAMGACEVANPAYDGIYVRTGDQGDINLETSNGGTSGTVDPSGESLDASMVVITPPDAAVPSIADTHVPIIEDAAVAAIDTSSVPDTAVQSMDAALTPTIVVVGEGLLLLSSRDMGATWQGNKGVAPHTDLNRYFGADFTGGQFFAMGWRVERSVDGVTWMSVSLPVPQWFIAAAHGNGRYMMVGGYGTVISSTDGITWSQGPSNPMGTTAAFLDVAFGGGRFAASNENNDVFVTSDNGAHWSLLPLKTHYVDYCNGDFYSDVECKTRTKDDRTPRLGLGTYWDLPWMQGLTRSSNGVTWTRVPSFDTTVNPRDIAFSSP